MILSGVPDNCLEAYLSDAPERHFNQGFSESAILTPALGQSGLVASEGYFAREVRADADRLVKNPSTVVTLLPRICWLFMVTIQYVNARGRILKSKLII
jgi:hypothetical protein